MTTQLQKQRKKSFDHIFKWAENQFMELADLFTKKKSEIILETARRLEKEGCEPSKISNEIVTNLSGFVDESYVRKVLKDYPQYNDHKQQANAKSGRNIPAIPAQQDDRKPLEIPTATVEPTNKSLPSPEVRTVEGIENDGEVTPNQQEELADVAEMASKILNLELEPKKSEPQMEQPGSTTKYLPGMPERYGVEYFEIEKLNIYPLEYCRKVIRWLNEAQEENTKQAFKWDKIIQEQAQENKTLKKQLEDSKPFIELLSLIPPEGKKAMLKATLDQVKEAKEGLRK